MKIGTVADWFKGIDSGVLERVLKFKNKINQFIFSFFQDSIRRNIFLFWLFLSFAVSTSVRQSSGFYFSSQNLVWLPVQFFLIWFASLITPKQCKLPLDILQAFMLIFLTIPTVIISFNNVLVQDKRVNVLSLIYVFLAQIGVKLLSDQFESISFLKVNWSTSKRSMLYGILALFVLTFIYLVINLKNNFHVTSLNQVYSQRTTLSANLSNANIFSKYALGWFSGLITPILLLTAIYFRKLFLVLLNFSVVFFIYGVTAQKWILASFFLIIFLIWIGRFLQSCNYSTHMVFVAFSCLISGTLSLSAVTFIPTISDLIIRRTLIDPAIMLQYYVTYSLHYPFSWWSDSNLSKLFIQNTKQPISNVIGERYFNVPEFMFYQRGSSANATAGSIGDSVGQGGLLALLLVIILLFLFFKILQDFAIGKNFVYVFALSALCVELLMEGTLHTLALSRGLVLVPLVFLMLPRSEQDDIQ